ncbi:MAG: ABC transporter ATP-binding protein [Gemmatimonadetes bacterium]|nr:ABC transporter ATP-binding protein [Gemmatimonadota bacterium]
MTDDRARRHDTADGTLLRVRDLTIRFDVSRDDAPRPVVDEVSFDLSAGETLGLVGESGSGKSLTALSIARLVEEPPARTEPGSSIVFAGEELVGATAERMRDIRGAEIGFVFQEPMTSLNPVMRVGDQVGESLRARGASRGETRERALELLRRVELPDPERASRAYPHELSGGMRQRAMIAMAVACEPTLLIADEPTTALDVTVQAQILDLLGSLQRETGLGLLLISHDLAVVSRVADRVAVMRAGRIVETGSTETVFRRPAHAYTRALLRAAPSLARSGDRGRVEIPPSGTEPAAADRARDERKTPVALEARGVSRRYRGRRRRSGSIAAVEDVSLEIAPAETVGLVGESGSGKSTLSRLLLGLDRPTAGEILFEGRSLTRLGRDGERRFRRSVQIVFQDPYGSLNPRLTIGAALREVLAVHGLADGSRRTARVAELLERVGLDPAMERRYPHELSGGERQRIGIARALAVEPKILIADEPVSALDVSVQARILELLKRLQRELGLGYLFVSHDLAVVRGIADRVLVMRDGRIVEGGPADRVYEEPEHEYTRSLLAAVPRLPATA